MSNNKQCIYLVAQKGLDSIELLDTAFSTRQKAEAYINRYKSCEEHQITEIHVDPEYHSDNSLDCYYVEMNLHDDKDVECYIANTLKNSHHAINGYYDIEYRFGVKLKILMYILAPNENEARSAAFNKRDEVLKNC